MKPQPRRASPEQVMVYGAISGRLRAWLDVPGRDIPQLNRAIGAKPDSTMAYGWRDALSAPSDQFRPALARLLECSEDDLRPNLPQGMTLRQWSLDRPKTGERDVQRNRAKSNGHTAPAAKRAAPEAEAKEATFALEPDGTAWLRLAIHRPLAVVLTALRLLEEAGIIGAPAAPPPDPSEDF